MHGLLFMADVIQYEIYDLRYFESGRHRIYKQRQFHRSTFPVLSRTHRMLLPGEQVMI
jgi:hypothetical protein